MSLYFLTMYLVTDPARFKALMGALPQLQMHNQRHGEIARPPSCNCLHLVIANNNNQ